MELSQKIAMFMQSINSHGYDVTDDEEVIFFVSHCSIADDKSYITHFSSSKDGVSAKVKIPNAVMTTTDPRKYFEITLVIEEDTWQTEIYYGAGFKLDVTNDQDLSLIGMYLSELYRVATEIFPTRDEAKLWDYVNAHKSPFRIHIPFDKDHSAEELQGYMYVVCPMLIAGEGLFGNHIWHVPAIFDTNLRARHTSCSFIQQKTRIDISPVVLDTYMFPQSCTMDVNAHSVSFFHGSNDCQGTAHIPIIRVKDNGQSSAEILMEAYRIVFNTIFFYKRKISAFSKELNRIENIRFFFQKR